ncbi:MAG: PEP-CTERM sorting domain-containing protein [Spirulina sp.]
MKIVQIIKPLAIALAAVGIICAIATPARGGQLHPHKDFTWNYGIDSFEDGSGGITYEYKGLAVTETSDKLIFAVSGGLNYNESSRDFAHGDLILNFSGKDATTASVEKSLLAVKFAPVNDTNFSVGLYKDVEVGDINDFVGINPSGYYDSLKHYYNKGFNKPNTYGTDLPTSLDTYKYFYGETVANNPTNANTPFLSAMKSGNRIDGISMLDRVTLEDDYDLDFLNFNAVGSAVFGFEIEKSSLQEVLPGGINNFMASLILECGNDGVALEGEVKIPVPEPSMILGLSAIAVGFLTRKCRSQS